jgi:hypothetical protein
VLRVWLSLHVPVPAAAEPSRAASSSPAGDRVGEVPDATAPARAATL